MSNERKPLRNATAIPIYGCVMRDGPRVVNGYYVEDANKMRVRWLALGLIEIGVFAEAYARGTT